MLSSDDLFGAVTFDDVAIQVQAITHVLPENQNTIINNILSIYPGVVPISPKPYKWQGA